MCASVTCIEYHAQGIYMLDLPCRPYRLTRGLKGHISCTWVQCATFLRNRPRRTLLFTDRPEKHKLDRGHWDLASCQVSLNSVQRFYISRKCSANQRPWRPSSFSDRPEKHKLGRECWVLAFCQVSLNFVQWFQRRSRKYEKLTTDGRRTTRDHNTSSALEPSAQVH